MRILFTNNGLAVRAGTELYVRDVCLALKRLGHEPACFTLDSGGVAAELIAAGVPVVDSLRGQTRPPDLIHGNHRIETTYAALVFPRCPVVSFCHGLHVWPEEPCVMPNVVAWVAVSEPCAERVVGAGGVDPRRVGDRYDARACHAGERRPAHRPLLTLSGGACVRPRAGRGRA